MQNDLLTTPAESPEFSKLEQMAYGYATAQFVSSSDDDFDGSWFERYQHLAECVDENKELDGWVAWEPFETWDWADIVDQIDSEAHSLLATLKQVLKYAKQGIVNAAIAGELDCFDMNLLDLVQMVEQGSKECEQ